ncbi:uncharacterized protein I303_104948 [Kwoniella dejecticola CBS 10117]|uniref:Zn(2)-C6 fungal-type domain-containing protein n=1 Tax=Kwoniella dejecticola CBS 10117 TaxID=1296121 RepID=A0A1A6A3W9_9TREE|nr:uncharacterized protein I303_05606 [Kwoniella dejecticola CBS 10117]OBR84747.1 hypothetical protein I303_05606 [Kwoniella dejecticola CBS 10117]
MQESDPRAESSAAPHIAVQPRRRITRTRTGCKVCRRRKIKCDLETPECARCVKYGVKCDWPKDTSEKIAPRSIRPAPAQTRGPLVSGKGPAAPIINIPIASTTAPAPDSDHHVDPINALHFNPILPSSQPVAPPSESTLDSSHTQATPLSMAPTNAATKRTVAALGWTATLEELGPLDRLLAVCRNTRMGLFFIQPSSPPDFLRSFFPSSEDLQCFHHCVTYTLSIIVVNEEHNPWIEHVAPLFMSNDGDQSGSQALRSSLLYIGAVHLSYLQGRNGDTAASLSTRTLALRYRTDCLRILRTIHTKIPCILNPTFFSACALCLTADLLAANNRWRELMRMVQVAINVGGGMQSILFPIVSGLVNPAMKCAVESLINLSLLGTLSATTDYSLLAIAEETRTSEGIPQWWSRLGEAESTQPELRKFDAACGISRSLVPRLSSLLSSLSDTGHPDQSTIDSLEQDWLSWDISKESTILDQRTQFGSLALWHAGRILILRQLRQIDRLDKRIQDAAAAILDICASVGDKVEYLNWPLIVACSTLVDATNRDIARVRLKEFKFQCCYELEIVQMVCEEMWARMDEGEDDEACGWVEILLESGCPVLLG